MASPYILLSGLRFAKAARQVILFLCLVQTLSVQPSPYARYSQQSAVLRNVSCNDDRGRKCLNAKSNDATKAELLAASLNKQELNMYNGWIGRQQ